MFCVQIICSLTSYFQFYIFAQYFKQFAISCISIYNINIFLIMIKLRNFIQFAFARNRIRREIQFDPKLKDFSNQQIIKLQKQDLRNQFQRVPDQTFSNVLNDPHPKLKKRFFVEKSALNKKIRQSYKQGIKRQLLQTHDDDDLDYLVASKSHLNDQKDEIQFERKFKQQLFRTKQTQRLIGKKQKQINNYVQGKQKDYKYLEYEDAKKHLKNKKISNMMSLNRNNEQLQLLIQSGFLNNPDNIKTVINQLTSSKTQGLLEHEGSNKTSPPVQQIVEFEDKNEKIANKLDDIGPQQLKQRQKIIQFLHNYEDQHEKDRLSCQQDLNLLKQIKEYEQEVYLSRYDDINFRFKGKVNFGFFKEGQLISYVKNQNIEPKQLLLMFKQNQNAISKFKVPILTPPVIGALYSKTSLYKFPQTDKNNRINMLNDKYFQMLQRKVFKDIALINDTDFCSVVWAYSHNHQDEQGILNKKLSDKILSVIVSELSFRIFNLNDEDLGLVLRGISRLPLAKAQNEWEDIIKYLENRLSSIENPYAIQSVFQFLMILPYSTEIAEAVSRNISLFNKFKWEEVNTVISFTHAAGLLLKNARAIGNQLAVRKAIRNILATSESELFQILPRISINNLPQFLAVVRQSQASLNLPKLVNLTKKLVVDNIKTQKQHIKQQSLSNLTGNFALTDIQKYLSTRIGKFQPKNSRKIEVTMRKLCLMQLIPFQAIPYNSSQYFVYHDLATLSHTQMHNINIIHLAKIFQNLSMVKYKNERIYDELATTILQNIDKFTDSRARQHQIVTGYSDASVVKALVSVCNSYSLQRRTLPLYDDALQLVLSPKYFVALCQQSPNALIRFVSGVVGLMGNDKLEQSKQEKLSKIVSDILIPLCKSDALLPQQVASIAFSSVLLSNGSSIQEICDKMNKTEVHDPTSKFVITFCSLIAKLGNNKAIQSQLSEQFNRFEQQFYKGVIEEILYNQSCIGTALPYHQVHAKLSEVLKNKHAGQTMINKKWAIQIPDIKMVYFIGTYDHLMARGGPNIRPVIEPHGIWKLYYKYYQLKGWQVKTVIGFMEGK